MIFRQRLICVNEYFWPKEAASVIDAFSIFLASMSMMSGLVRSYKSNSVKICMAKSLSSLIMPAK